MDRLTRTISIDLGQRAEGQQTYPATLSSETPVRRRDWQRGEYEEILSHARGAIDLSRAPLPLLESHDAGSLPIGVAENLRVVDGRLRGELRFGASARAQEIEADVGAGVIRNLSIGYRIQELSEKTEGKAKTLTATKWQPLEASAVAVGADASAGIGRSDIMENENATDTRSAEELERERCTAIVQTARGLGVDADDLIQQGTPIDEARKLLIERHVKNERSVPTPSAGGRASLDDLTGNRQTRSAGWMGRRIEAGPDDGAEFRAAATDAVLLRAGVHVEEPHAAAKDVSPSVIDLARTCVSRAGRTVSGGHEALIRGAMSTSDFPNLLADAMHKATRRGFEDEPSSHRAWVRSVPVPDFRDQHRPILGSAPDLEHIPEGAEYTHGSLDEGSTSYRVQKFGRIVSLSWEALVNDDLNAFLRIQPSMDQAARRKEADTVYDLFAENGGDGPQMQDGVVLFHSDHNNLATAGNMDADGLASARQLLRKQVALGGGYLSLVPRFLILPAELEHDADIVLAEATRSIHLADSAVPQWISRLEPVVEPRLAADAYYVAADAAQIDHVERVVSDP